MLWRHIIQLCCKNAPGKCLMDYHVYWDVNILSAASVLNMIFTCVPLLALLYTPISVRDE
jgi:hypothetical protein